MKKTKADTTKVALIYDWADTAFGGAENVLLALQEIYPQADLFVSFADRRRATWLKRFPRVYTSFIQQFPRWCWRYKALLAPFLPRAFESFNLSAYQIVISVSSFVAKGVLTAPSQFHLCYLLTPTRFLYSHQHTYLSRIINLLTLPIQHYLRQWDQRAIKRPTKVVAISKLVADRCQQFYGRTVEVFIYPTVIASDFAPPTKPIAKDYFLVVSRLVSYKKIDLVVRACGQAGYPLYIIGGGRQLPALKKLVQQNEWHSVKFLGNLPTADLKSWYQGAKALIAPGLEDFGINLLEANSCGTLVISNQDSGARELLDRQTALDLPRVNLKTLASAVAKCHRLPKQKLTAKFLGYNTKEFQKLFKQTQEKYYARQKP